MEVCPDELQKLRIIDEGLSPAFGVLLAHACEPKVSWEPYPVRPSKCAVWHFGSGRGVGWVEKGDTKPLPGPLRRVLGLSSGPFLSGLGRFRLGGAVRLDLSFDLAKRAGDV
jgi:hypothetical protein